MEETREYIEHAGGHLYATPEAMTALHARHWDNEALLSGKASGIARTRRMHKGRILRVENIRTTYRMIVIV